MSDWLDFDFVQKKKKVGYKSRDLIAQTVSRTVRNL